MNNLIKDLMQPALSRVGTIAATWLVAHGFDSQYGVTVETAITAVGLFGVDFVVRSAFKRWGGR